MIEYVEDLIGEDIEEDDDFDEEEDIDDDDEEMDVEALLEELEDYDDDEAAEFISRLELPARERAVADRVVKEIGDRLGFLVCEGGSLIQRPGRRQGGRIGAGRETCAHGIEEAGVNRQADDRN